MDLPQPLVGFIRDWRGERLLALFNLAETPQRANLTPWPGLRAVPASGFEPDIDEDGAMLAPFGALFAQLHSAERPALMEA